MVSNEINLQPFSEKVCDAGIQHGSYRDFSAGDNGINMIGVSDIKMRQACISHLGLKAGEKTISLEKELLNL